MLRPTPETEGIQSNKFKQKTDSEIDRVLRHEIFLIEFRVFLSYNNLNLIGRHIDFSVIEEKK